MGPGLLVVGANHRTAPVELRARLALDPDQIRHALGAIKSDRVLSESMILSTCNRTEIYSLAPDTERAEAYVRELIARYKGHDVLRSGPESYALRDRDMASHLFRVVASLDSMMLGEVQILGQVKDAWELAQAQGSAGAFLSRLLSTAMRVGKRARAETAIGTGSVSVASAAVTLTQKIMSDLASKRVLLVGAGDTGRLAARHFAECRPAAIAIANRTLARAAAVAAELGGEALALDDLAHALVKADVVVCATRSPGPVVTASMVRAAMRERRNRPMVIVDIAVPRNVEAEVDRVESVFSYSIDALETLVDQNVARRRREVPRVEAIIGEELERFFRWTRTARVSPVVRALRQKFEAARDDEVTRHLRQFPAEQHERVQALTRALVNKLLHPPTVAIKRLDLATDDGQRGLETVCDLFDLPHPGDLPADADAERAAHEE